MYCKIIIKKKKKKNSKIKYNYTMENWVAVIDLKAYYATFECLERGLDPFTTPLAVTDTTRKESTIVLSVSPYLKSLGVPSRCRRRDLPNNIKGMIYAVPQMEKYVKKSAEVVSIMLDFVGRDDIHVYSIDESFLNIGPYLKLNKCGPVEFCKKILAAIKEKTGLIGTCGIGPNMFLAKVADDKEAKYNKDYIALWDYKDVENKLWPIKPLDEIWGISHGFKKRLNALGLYCVGDVAKYNKELLIKEFGILGEDIYEHCNGRDDASIREKYIPVNKNLSLGQVLMRDYTKDEAELIIKEMVDELCFRLRQTKLKARGVSLFIRYSFSSKDEPFAHQLRLTNPTDLNSELQEALLYIYKNYVSPNGLIRQIGISYGSLVEAKTMQVSLFKNLESLDKEESMYKAIDEIQKKYGKNSILKGTSLLKESTIKERHNQIGGHRK